jgi:hypothetical protein
MRICSNGIVSTVVWLCLHNASAAIDYAPSWNFSQSIANQTSAPLGSGFLVYNDTTGELVYNLGENGIWSPPDVGSKSGLLTISETLQPVPLWGTPTFRVDESFEGNVVIGSNAIRVNFDRYAFWPWEPESAEVLQAHGLSHVPTSYSYGAVLPAGLTMDLLETDLYTVSFPNSPIELRVVPEPATMALIVIAGLITRAFCPRAGKKRKAV